MMKIAAGIVLFNPDVERLEKCLRALLKQVDEIVIFDNVGNFQDFFTNSEYKITYLTEGRNMGISYALNKIMNLAKSKGFDWVLTMDQDTVIPAHMLEEFYQYPLTEYTAIICPQVIDKRRVYMHASENPERYVATDFCITSASCTNLDIWKSIGGFDEKLFIDFVDNDYCKRLRLKGLEIIVCNRVVIDQQFGNIELKSSRQVAFFLWLSKLLKNKNIAKLTYKKKVSPLRVYFVHRNLIYLNEKFKDSGGIGYENFYSHSFCGFLLNFTLPSLVRSNSKILVLKSIIKGLYDGYKLAKNYARLMNNSSK